MNDIHLWPANRVTSGSDLSSGVTECTQGEPNYGNLWHFFTAGNWGHPMTVVLISDFDVN